MKKEQLEQIVNETLGFNPKEFRYKLEEHDDSIEGIKQTLAKVLPMIGTTMLEFNLIKNYLAENKLDATEYIKAGIKAAFEANKEGLARLKVKEEHYPDIDEDDEDEEDGGEKPKPIVKKRKVN